MKLFWAALAVACCGGAAAWAGGSRPQFVFRIHLQASEANRPEQCVPVDVPDPQVRLFVQKYAVVSEKHILGAQSNGRGGLLLEFKPDGRSALEAATSTNQGKMLVVFLNERLVYTARIDTVLHNGRFIVPRGVTPEDLKLLEAYLAARRKL
jgi:hypothetical protein